MLDIFSRKAIHWEVHATENADLARAFIDATVISNGGIAPDAIHAGRGTSMTSEVPRAFRTVHPIGWAIWKGEIIVPSEEELLTGI